MSGVSCRRLGPDDQADWRRLRLEGLERFPNAFLTTFAEQSARTPDQDRALLSHGTWRGLFSGTQMIGLGALIPMRHQAARHRTELGAFYITPDHWGGGAAQYLWDALVAEARAAGALQIELSVSSQNPRAIRFYERNGCERVGVQPRAVLADGVATDDFAYVCYLDR